ncbi:uncharacterized protein LOC108103329 [Drosophila eugracilis]|uniref:uncharacterized protein LOC108103329 n=1 Tax=Drosophila eugracilis TaxID=29029 RepID=UPI0007E78721|nr:uncharacterized protein LOC108103329 [Drosophila eugracilis]
MQPPLKSYSCLLLLFVLSAIDVARTAPRQASSYVIPLAWKDLLEGLNFPEPQEKSQEIPEPRAVYVNLEDPASDSQQFDLQQVLLLTSGLSPAQIAQRSQGRNEGRFFSRGTTVVVVTGTGSGGAINNNNTNTVVTNATAVPASTTTTATRAGEFIRAPIGYPAGLPMQYFRKRQDDGSLSSPALTYPELFGWNEAAFYGGDLGSSYAGLGGLNGGYSLPGVPLVPITIGNEVRYVPMNLRMYRQLASSPPPPPPPPMPAIREEEDQLGDDDISGFAVSPELEVDEESLNDGGQEVGSSGHSVGVSPGYGILGQRLRPRPLARRRPLQSLAQNIRRVQYLK